MQYPIINRPNLLSVSGLQRVLPADWQPGQVFQLRGCDAFVSPYLGKSQRLGFRLYQPTPQPGSYVVDILRPSGALDRNRGRVALDVAKPPTLIIELHFSTWGVRMGGSGVAGCPSFAHCLSKAGNLIPAGTKQLAWRALECNHPGQPIQIGQGFCLDDAIVQISQYWSSLPNKRKQALKLWA